MSFEAARRILQMYQQSNTQRINDAMRSAYNEAMTAFQSETAAREAAVSILEQEEKSFREMIKSYNSVRREQMRGNFRIARSISAAQIRNKKRQHAADEKNKNLKARQYNEAQRLKAMSAKGSESRFIAQADDHARSMTRATEIYQNNLSNQVNEIVTILREGPSDTAFRGKLRGSEGGALRSAFQQAKRRSDQAPTQLTKLGKGSQKEALSEFSLIRQKSLGDEFIADVIEGSGLDEDDPKIEELRSFIFEKGNNSRAGIYESAAKITPEQQRDAYDAEKKEYLDRYRPVRVGGLAALKPAVAFQEEIPTLPDDTVDKQLVEQAQEVFNQLRANDDTPFELTESELQNISPDAINAYQQLKRVIVQNPLAVTLEEQTLLDDLALSRQLQILRRKDQISRMNPQMKSPEAIRYRAAELAEPGGKKSVASSLPASAQKYYATQRQAYDLSDKDDQSVSNLGKPEQMGVSLYKELFDPSIRGFKDNATNDTLVERINEGFPSSEDQLRALTAFYSRAMAFQRSQNPIVLPSGARNEDYVDALNKLSFEK